MVSRTVVYLMSHQGSSDRVESYIHKYIHVCIYIFPMRLHSIYMHNVYIHVYTCTEGSTPLLTVEGLAG